MCFHLKGFDSTLLFGQMSVLSMNIMNELNVLLHNFIIILCKCKQTVTQ